MADSEQQPTLAWTAMPYRARVLAADESEIGSAESLLGDEAADIFHGIVVKRREGGRLFEIPAAHVKKITSAAVLTDLRPEDLSGLEPYREERWYHIGWGGLFRKHPEWDEKSHR